MLNASFLTAGFVVLAVGARYLLSERHPEQGRTMIKMAVVLLAILAPLQLLLGDLHGLNTLRHQPIKIAAMEAHWDSHQPVDFHIFAWPNETAERNDFALSIPNAGSLILTHRLNGLIIGLKDVAPQNRPPVKTVFFAFRIMLAIGFFMIAAALTGAWLLWRGILFETRWYLRVVAQSWWTGFVAVIAGWVVTESGRQPWVVQGILRTADATSPLAASTVLTSLILFVVVYAIVFAMGIYYINRLIERGPQGRAVETPEQGSPLRPLSSAHDAGREALASRS
jgi:cytochrome d ubiquinol oxidase subunit I